MPSYNAMSDNIYNYDENGEPLPDNYKEGDYQVGHLRFWLLDRHKMGGNGNKWVKEPEIVLKFYVKTDLRNQPIYLLLKKS